MRILVGGVGYRHLSDHSFGVAMIDRLAARAWAPDVSVEDVSYNPIALVQRLEDDPPDRRFDLAIIIGAMPRLGRTPGTVAIYRWDNRLPPDDEVHQAITEAVTGVISLDNTLVIARYFKALPDTVVIVEAEPLVHAHGDDLSAPLAAAFERTADAVAQFVREPATTEALPVDCLGGDRTIDARFGAARISDVYARRN